MEANFNDVKRLIYKGREYDKMYAGNIKIWSKPASFVAKPLPINKEPDDITDDLGAWTIEGVIPNRTYQIQINNLNGGTLKVSQTKLGDSELKSTEATSDSLTTSITFTNPEGKLYITMNRIFMKIPQLTIR